MSQEYRSHEVVHGARFDSEGAASQSACWECAGCTGSDCHDNRQTMGRPEAVSVDARDSVRRQDQDGVDELYATATDGPSPPALPSSARKFLSWIHHAAALQSGFRPVSGFEPLPGAYEYQPATE